MVRRETVKHVILGLLVALVVLGAATFAWVWWAPCSLGGCAPLDNLAEYQAEGSQLVDVDGTPFGTLATVDRRVVPLDSLPPYVPQAFVAIEDRRFYEHGGVDLRRVLGAVIENIRAGSIEEGGSTITMQLARNLFPDWLPYTEQSLRRKLLEARVARQMERRFSKQKILELYLNHIYLGSGAYGVGAAAREYFGKPASELTLAEAATLAALPKAPSELSPEENPEGARERRDLVLEAMAEQGYISRDEENEARAGDIDLAAGGGGPRSNVAPYFTEWVRQEMADRIGSSFYTSGLTIYTTLDLDAQRAAKEELARELDDIEAGAAGTFRHPTYPESKGESKQSGRTPYLQGAVVLMDVSSGEVRALVGGRDYGDSKFDRATQARRQPGSAFKPFVYLTALENGLSPISQVEDAPLRVHLADGKVWAPANYGDSYGGVMTLRNALTHSKNTATVRLAQQVGIGSIIGTAHRLGITSDIPAVPSTALGVADVRPIEMAQAYAAFANGGYGVTPHVIRKVVDRNGRTLWEAGDERRAELDPALAFVLTSMLEDVVNRGTGGRVRAVGFRGPAAGKTGTTNDATDAWFIGYTPELVGAVWMGFDEPQTIVRGASGGTLAAPVWGRMMRRIYATRPTPEPWRPPADVETAEVEVGTDRVVSASCPAQGATYTEYFVHYAPVGMPCLPATRYTSTARSDSFWADTLWMDDEWDAPPEPSDLSQPERPGVDWPQLEALRRRRAESARRDRPFDDPGTAYDTTFDSYPDTVESYDTATTPYRVGTDSARRTPPAPPSRPSTPQDTTEPALLGRPLRPTGVPEVTTPRAPSPGAPSFPPGSPGP